MGDLLKPEQAMRLAIETARRGEGYVSPNPLVGCVIVDKDHKLLATGAHLKCGEAHAEINALREVKDHQALKGSTFYVTLEPCSHQGRTGPCAVALAALPIAQVFYGQLDPNPLVAGRGLEILKASGIQVAPFSEYQSVCADLIESFAFHIEKRQPYVALKVATSLDGMIALKSGESKWITSGASRLKGRELRALYDATLIGTGTLRHDDPSLDFRDTAFAGKKENKIVILDSNGKGSEIFDQSRLAKIHPRKNIFVLTRQEHLSKWAPHLVHLIPWEASKPGWETALKNLYQKGIASLYVEGGAYVFSQFLQFHLANKLYHFQAPKILGEGINWTQYLQLQSLEQARPFSRWESVSIDQDRLNIIYF